MTQNPKPSVGAIDASRELSVALVAAGLTTVSLAAVLGAHWDTVADIERAWRESGSYGHGHLVLLISLYLTWRARSELGRCALRMQPLGLVALVLLSGLWLAADLIEAQVGKQLVLVPIMAACVWALLGGCALRILAFPIGYLMVAIPVWDLLVPMLQTQTAVTAARSLQLIGVPVYLEGFQLSIPEGRFEIAEVCAGLRYLLATMAIAALYAYLHLRPLWRGVIFFAVAIVISIVFNWLRVDAIIWIGHITDMQSSLVHSHIEFGWAMFALGLIPLFLIGHWMQGRDPSEAAGPTKHPSEKGSLRIAPFAGMAIAVVGLSAIGPLAARAIGEEIGTGAPVALGPIEGAEAWAGPLPPEAPLDGHFAGVDAEYSAQYAKDISSVELFVAFFQRQAQGKEVINETNSLYDRDRWNHLGERELTMDFGSGGEQSLMETRLGTSRGEVRLVWHLYFVGGHAVADRYAAKLLQLWGLLRGRREAAVVAFHVDAAGDPSVARATLSDFAAAVGPRVIAALNSAAAGAGD